MLRHGRRWPIGDFEFVTANCHLSLKEFVTYEIASHATLEHILTQLSDRPGHQWLLDEINQWLGERAHSLGEFDSKRTLQAIRGAVQSRELFLLQRRSRSGASRNPSQEVTGAPSNASSPVPKKEKTWIEIQLLDENDRPVANRSYRLKIPDGSVRTGKLSQDGVVRVNGIDPGECEITYLDLDDFEWPMN